MSKEQPQQTGVVTRRDFLGAAAATGIVTAGAWPAIAQAAATPQRGGTLNWLVDPEPPLLTAAIQTAGPTRAIGPKINEGLLDFDFDWTPIPALATRWQVSPDGLEYVFTLRRGVKWHDGKPFGAADVAFSILYLKQNHPNGRGTYANVSEVTTPDSHTVRLKLTAPAPYLLRALAANESPILPKHLFDGRDPLSNPAHNAPIGTGPFVFKEWVKGSHILLERNPDYWDAPRPYVDRIVVKFIADPAARAAALESGAVDLAGDSPIPLSDLERFRQLPHIRLETRGYDYAGDLNQIVFNLDNPYLKHLEVRQAIAHAIDKQAILKLIWYGYGEVASGPIIPAQRTFFDPGLPRYAHDLKKAEALLDQAGFARGADGVRFTLTNDFLPYGPNFRRGSEYIRQTLGRVGIRVNIRAQDFPTYIRRVYNDRDFDFANAWLGNSFDPTVGVQRLFWSKNFRKGVPFSNGSHYANEQVDAWFEQAAIEPDPAVRAQLFSRVQHQLVHDLPHLDLVAQKNVTVAHVRVQDATTSITGLRGSLSRVWLAPA